jgi:hypothetical protein
MSNGSGRVALSALDLLGLAEQKKVGRVDLAEAGYSGIVYVCDLTAAQQQQIVGTPRRGSKVRRNDKENWTEFDLADLANNAGARFLEACLVTDKAGGDVLERAFEAARDEDGALPGYITLPAAELVFQAELMRAELKSAHLVREKLEQFPNAVSSLIVGTMRRLSGMDEDKVEEKKENS